MLRAHEAKVAALERQVRSRQHQVKLVLECSSWSKRARMPPEHYYNYDPLPMGNKPAIRECWIPVPIAAPNFSRQISGLERSLGP